MIIKIKKLYKGCVDLRDYNVKDCIKRNENYIINYSGELMSLSPDDMVNKCIHRQNAPSIIGTDDYELWSYKWEPNEQNRNRL